MTRDVVTAKASTDLQAIIEILQARRISSVPIVDPAGAPIGLVARTDLIRLGLLQTGLRGTTPVIPLPPRRASEVMTTALVTMTSDRTLRDAAREMAKRSIHRILVTEAGRLVGIVSTIDLAIAVHGARIETPISAWMTSPVVTVQARQPVAAAVDLLDRLHISAVVVVDDDWPVGTFSQVDALAARDLPRDTPVDAVMDTAIVCMPSTVRAFRAAAQAARLDVRRVIVTIAGEIVGVVGGLDFARMVEAG